MGIQLLIKVHDRIALLQPPSAADFVPKTLAKYGYPNSSSLPIILTVNLSLNVISEMTRNDHKIKIEPCRRIDKIFPLNEIQL
jgi:hypothetical protein